MPLIPQKDQDFLKEKFGKELIGEVRMVYFTQRESKLIIPGQECPFCRETRELLEEVAALSEKIHLEVYDFIADTEKVNQYRVDKIPATIIHAEGDGAPNLRYFGIPSGYEFATLIEDLLDVSKGRGELAQKTRDELKKVDRDIHIQVFVTPT